MAEILLANKENIKKTVHALQTGNLIGLPTETVYGLGADATNDEAVQNIFKAKNRPDFNPLIVHVTDWNMVEEYAKINDKAKALAQNFWPGPLSIILPLKENTKLSKYVSGGLNTVAMRSPNHPISQELLQSFSKPIAAPSANISGTLSPTTPAHVQQSLGEYIDIILAGGKCNIGLESTIIDMSSNKPIVLRAGFILPETIADVLGEDVAIGYEEITIEKPHAPGMLLNHYAPKTPLRLKAIDIEENEALLGFGSTKFMSIRNKGNIPDTQILNLSPTGDLTEAAANLFTMLHELDDKGYERIAVMDIPNTGIGIAINDRLKRGARGTK